MTANPTLPGTTRVGQVCLRVGDLAETTRFYESVVGLAVLESTDEHAVLGAGGTPLLRLTAAPEAPPRRREETGLFHTAFLVPSRAALGAALERVDAEWRLDGASDHRVSEALYLSDPEGNGVEIYRDRPRADWPVDGDTGHVRMDTLPLDTDDLRSESDGSDRAPPATTVGHVHLEVSLTSDAESFYVDALGLNLRQRFGPSASFVAAGDYHHHLGLNTWNGRTDPPSGRGLAWFELVVPDGETLAAVADRLETDVDPPSDVLAVEDQDGIAVRIRTPSEGD